MKTILASKSQRMESALREYRTGGQTNGSVKPEDQSNEVKSLQRSDCSGSRNSRSKLERYIAEKKGMSRSIEASSRREITIVEEDRETQNVLAIM